VPFPPRTAMQNATNPPQMFLEKLGFSSHFVHQTVTYNGYDIPWASVTVHMLFSIVVGGLIYILLAEKFPQIRLWQGVAYGLVGLDRPAPRHHACHGDRPGPVAPAVPAAPVGGPRPRRLDVGHRADAARPAQPHHA
jgi:Protein of unknown function (DUF1440)